MKKNEKIKILIVDDTSDIITQLQQILISEGYEVFVANSGEKALQRLEINKPDLILLDIIMPGIDGYETCRKIKSDTKIAYIPVIFMSALLETFDKVKAFGTGAVDYITKPLNTEELLVRIKTHISINRLQKELTEANSKLEEKVEQRTIELRASEAKYRSLFENSQEGIWVIDKNNITTIVNPAMGKMLGYKPEEIIGKNLFDFMDKKEKLLASENIERRKKGISEQHDFELIKKNGEVIFATMEAAPLIDENGEYFGAIAGVIDITARKHAEIQLRDKNQEYEALNEELKQTNDELQNAKQKAEESDHLKTAFLQNMSHEIRTPMNAIIGFSSFLNKPELSEEKRKSFISIIINSTNQLLSIVNDILTISAVETKQEKIKIQKVCINNIIVDLLAIFKTQAFNQNISLYAKQQLSDNQSEIYTDNTKIVQILTNLLTNALKFTHEGYVEFGYTLVETQNIASQNQTQNIAPQNQTQNIAPQNQTQNIASLQQIQFYVKDTGIGITPNQQEKIFERFRQADLSITKKYGGTGLGLSISKGFAELLGGKIWVESEPEKGSTFYFSIPYNPVNNANISIQNKKSNRKTILVAEDEEFNFLLIEELLINMDYTLIHSKEGKETVEICKSNPNIDLILMDIKMPLMDGHTAAKLIKQFRPDLAIIAQTAYALDHEKAKFNGKEFDDYIIKPINEEELKQKVMKYIDNQ